MKLVDTENRSLVARGQGRGWVGEMGDLAFLKNLNKFEY